MNKEMLVRITRYYRILTRLQSLGLEKVFAHNLADAAGVSAAIVRKDFSVLNIHGQKRGGYEIDNLFKHLGDILGKTDEPQHIVIVGCGRIGKALMHYSGFESDGIKVVAGFDTDPSVYNDTSHPVPVYPLDKLEQIIDKEHVEVAILTVPERATSDSYKRLVQTGIKGVLNFSPITLKPIELEDGTSPIIHNVNIALELEQMFYQLRFAKEE
ncbi:MAG: redox-sensing transcriptional repressor Rex [Sphaerochaetaceae bacterium]|jgi:redox-sensing transcriptional repressor